MSDVMLYPPMCRKAIRKLHQETGMDSKTAYSMMLMTATLMDLRPEDDRVLQMILTDCGIRPKEMA